MRREPAGSSVVAGAQHLAAAADVIAGPGSVRKTTVPRSGPARRARLDRDHPVGAVRHRGAGHDAGDHGRLQGVAGSVPGRDRRRHRSALTRGDRPSQGIAVHGRDVCRRHVHRGGEGAGQDSPGGGAAHDVLLGQGGATGGDEPPSLFRMEHAGMIYSFGFFHLKIPVLRHGR